ncbi:MAG: UDP-N-acetylenolpyruvoylglucosamine reductase [Steroidobacteraceae bacterium]|nr:UDP-N-acetylenolpyruvoylglucosamine reductase [Steroidobacteraceae bacterium]
MSTATSVGYRVLENARLDARNTFGVRATTPLLVEVRDATVLPDLFGGVIPRDPSTLVLGSGSNVLFAGEPPGAVLALNTRAFGTTGDEGGRALVRADAGVVWHDFVLWTLGQGLSGLENLALIPGTVGAAPIQNIGAYGAEVCEFIHAVEAFDRTTGQFVRLGPGQCNFAYRDSLFKHEPHHYLVTAVEFALARNFIPRLGYAGIAEELAAMGIVGVPRAMQVAEAVIRIRRRKLPDPARLPNAGSFFKNPIVPAAHTGALLAIHPSLPLFRTGDEATRKLSAAWLIDACGWKGHREGDAGVAPTHALVLVNHGNASGMQLLGLARRIADSVQARFGVKLEPEPRIIGVEW